MFDNSLIGEDLEAVSLHLKDAACFLSIRDQIINLVWRVVLHHMPNMSRELKLVGENFKLFLLEIAHNKGLVVFDCRNQAFLTLVWPIHNSNMASRLKVL